MRQASKRTPESAEKTVRDIRRATRRHHSAEEKIRVTVTSENFMRDIAPVASIYRGPAVLVVHPSFPARFAAANDAVDAFGGRADLSQRLPEPRC
jgi:hypothetical protein